MPHSITSSFKRTKVSCKHMIKFIDHVSGLVSTSKDIRSIMSDSVYSIKQNDDEIEFNFDFAPAVNQADPKAAKLLFEINKFMGNFSVTKEKKLATVLVWRDKRFVVSAAFHHQGPVVATKESATLEEKMTGPVKSAPVETIPVLKNKPGPSSAKNEKGGKNK